MKILVLNGSPKGEHSITLQFLVYLQRKYIEHDISIVHVAQKIKKLEKDEEYFSDVMLQVKNADLVIWSFGVWVLAVSAQLMRFIELIGERGESQIFRNKYAAAISTSIKFYDHTAHNYIRACSEDLEMKFIDAASFYILDFMREAKRTYLEHFFTNLTRSVERSIETHKRFPAPGKHEFVYKPGAHKELISSGHNILVLTDNNDTDSNLGRMIAYFCSNFEKEPGVLDLNEVDTKGACMGCMKCGYDYNCQYKDGFREFYTQDVMNADILVFAGSIKNRFLSSTWKTFFDRAFFWNHTPSLKGKQIAYLLSGPLSENHNLAQMLEGHVTARQLANLVDMISDEVDNSAALDSIIRNMAERSIMFANQGFVRPDSFLGVGGHKIFRDEIYGHLRGVWQADHRYYKKNKLYNFPPKQRGLRIMNFFLILLCKIPSFRKKFYNGIMKFPAKRFTREMDKLLSNTLTDN